MHTLHPISNNKLCIFYFVFRIISKLGIDKCAITYVVYVNVKINCQYDERIFLVYPWLDSVVAKLKGESIWVCVWYATYDKDS